MLALGCLGLRQLSDPLHAQHTSFMLLWQHQTAYAPKLVQLAASVWRTCCMPRPLTFCTQGPHSEYLLVCLGCGCSCRAVETNHDHASRAGRPRKEIPGQGHKWPCVIGQWQRCIAPDGRGPRPVTAHQLAKSSKHHRARVHRCNGCAQLDHRRTKRALVAERKPNG